VEDEVFYRYREKWNKLPLEPFELLGELKNLKQIEQDLWLVYDDTLIRYSMARKESFQFTARMACPRRCLPCMPPTELTMWWLPMASIASLHRKKELLWSFPGFRPMNVAFLPTLEPD
jgi:hypothetical protein